MQRIILLLAVLYIFQISANAQDKNSIAGSVADSTSKHALEYATITLSDAKTNKVLNGGTTDSVGYFKLNDIEAGTYNISFESIGYAKKITHNITIKESHIPNNMGTIFLRKSANTLADVVVSSQVPQIENKIDKIVFNTANDVTSQGGVATDVLKKVPQVSVDADGNVELAGSSGIRFLIDGKPSTAFGSNIADVLQS
ncbi:MAG: carboxypeptidase-like regulatory domain-containing protein, partial [Parafilimonas sp.]